MSKDNANTISIKTPINSLFRKISDTLVCIKLA